MMEDHDFGAFFIIFRGFYLVFDPEGIFGNRRFIEDIDDHILVLKLADLCGTHEFFVRFNHRSSPGDPIRGAGFDQHHLTMQILIEIVESSVKPGVVEAFDHLFDLVGVCLNSHNLKIWGFPKGAGNRLKFHDNQTGAASSPTAFSNFVMIRFT
jgi:hypothetical protein